MELRILEKCSCGYEDCGGFDYLVFITKPFQFRFFNDNGYKFLYIHLGQKYWRWDW
jgi:hypothetical protein